jgi:fused signal recognition particle receptor
MSNSLLSRLKAGLAKTRTAMLGGIDELLRGRRSVDAALLEELEERLLAADFGLRSTEEILAAVRERCRGAAAVEPLALRRMLAEEVSKRLQPRSPAAEVGSASPYVILVVGVNGVGKTTSVGKLARYHAGSGRKVILGAADTFRAAAAEQLAIWGERSGVEVIRHADGADPAAVAFDAARAALARKADLLMLDTAGRLHTKVNLMEELKKLHRVLAREIPGAPHETLLVLDATTGQNALTQARTFMAAVAVDGIILTKLDGTARGGMAVAIAGELGLPVRFVGVGEGIDDLRPFDAELFARALFDLDGD